MAPEAAVLKRKRSRPSDYWIVGANATPQHDNNDAPVVKEAERRSLSDATETAVGNRGRSVKKNGRREGENEYPDVTDGSKAGSAQGQGRLSGTMPELRLGGSIGSSKAASSKIAGENARSSISKTKTNQGRGAKNSRKTTEPNPMKDGGQLGSVDVEAPISTQKKRIRNSLPKSDASVISVSPEQAESSAQPSRHGRLFNTAADGPEFKEAAALAKDGSHKRGRTTGATAKPEVDELMLEVEETSPKQGKINLQDARLSQQLIGDSRKRRIVQMNDGGASRFDELSSPIEERRVQKRVGPSEASQLPAEIPTKRGKKSTSQIPHIDIQVETASSKLTNEKPKSAVGRKTSTIVNSKPSSASPASGKAGMPRKVSKLNRATSNITPSSHKFVKTSNAISIQAKGRKRKGEEANVIEKSSKRQRIDQKAHDEEINPEISERTPYPHLEPTTRRVSRLKIETKWEPLPPGCIDQISTLLSDLQNPVIARLKEDRKKSQTSVALKSVSRKLVKKLSKGLPFPRATGRTIEDDFDYEKILDHSRALESQLTPVIHANELLEAELRKEMARLESDQQNLADLEVNSKKEAVLRNNRSRSLHSLLHSNALYEASKHQFDIGLEDKKVGLSLDTSITDAALRDLIQGLSGHIDSIQGNVKQVDGIVESLAKTKGAVQARLFDQLDRSQYEAVVLGTDA